MDYSHIDKSWILGSVHDASEGTRLDPSSNIYVSRLCKIVDLLMKRGGFSAVAASKALVGPPRFGNKVAKWLRDELARLREDEKTVSMAPVLSGNALGRTMISDIAFTMLEGRKPCPQLLLLLAELLNVDRHRGEKDNERRMKKEWAISIENDDPTIGVRKLARMVEVAPSTITQWRKDPWYQDQIRPRDRHLAWSKKMKSAQE
jgi:hypothetical protein